MSSDRMRHAFTVDVEDWFHGIPVSGETKASAERRLHQGLDRLLELLSARQVRVTFFWLGPLVRDHPDLVRAAQREGHENGSHGWGHELVYQLSPSEFREDILRASRPIEDVTGAPVTAYRAPYFSITRRSFWALEVLASLGFRYDSSIFPMRNWRYGIPDFECRPQRIGTPAGSIMELPLTVRRVFGRNIPVSGGAYFRLYPYALTRANILASEREGRPVVFYLHPWELDPGHPRVRFHWKARLTHYVNLRSTEPKLRRLLGEFSFAPLGEVLENVLT